MLAKSNMPDNGIEAEQVRRTHAVTLGMIGFKTHNISNRESLREKFEYRQTVFSTPFQNEKNAIFWMKKSGQT